MLRWSNSHFFPLRQPPSNFPFSSHFLHTLGWRKGHLETPSLDFFPLKLCLHLFLVMKEQILVLSKSLSFSFFFSSFFFLFLFSFLDNTSMKGSSSSEDSSAPSLSASLSSKPDLIS